MDSVPQKTARELWGEATFLVPAGQLPSSLSLCLSPTGTGKVSPTIAPGGMTTAGTLTAVFFYLSRHPAAYARLASEIRATFADAQAIKSGPLLARLQLPPRCH